MTQVCSALGVVTLIWISLGVFYTFIQVNAPRACLLVMLSSSSSKQKHTAPNIIIIIIIIIMIIIYLFICKGQVQRNIDSCSSSDRCTEL